jgi:hypothetical protein
VTLALKILLSPACVVAVSMTGRRWGLAAAFSLAVIAALAAQAVRPAVGTGWRGNS